MIKHLFSASLATLLCAHAFAQKQTPGLTSKSEQINVPFKVEADRFADIQVLRYQVPGFETLSAKQI